MEKKPQWRRIQGVTEWPAAGRSHSAGGFRIQCWESNRSQNEPVAAMEEEHLWLYEPTQQLALRLRTAAIIL